jgi:hypothetical protein
MSDEVKVPCSNRGVRAQTRMPEVVSHIVSRCDQARLMEFYYWTQEPELLEIIRAVAGMSKAGREALESFFRLGGDPQTVTATWETDGRLVLESDNLGRALEVVTYLMADPTGINRESEPN